MPIHFRPHEPLGQKGVMSFITVILLAIVLSIITTGFIHAMIINQRQTIDEQLSTQAFYAAETGVQDAIKYLQEGGAAKSDCAPATSASLGTSPNVVKPSSTGGTTADVEYTCQTIKTDLSDMLFTVPQDTSKQVHLKPGGSFNKIEIQWHLNSATPDGDGVMATGSAAYCSFNWWKPECTGVKLRSTDSLASVSSWGNAPALLRTAVIPISSSAAITRQDVLTKTSNLFFTPAANSTVLGEGNGMSASKTCSAANLTYVCKATITLASSVPEAYLRLRSVYKDTHVKIVLYNGATVLSPGTQAEIDVTGRANDVYRRIRVRVPLSGVQDTTGFPEYAIESAEGICKQILVGTAGPSNNGQGVEDANGPSAACKSLP